WLASLVDAPVADVVDLRRAAELLRSNLLKLALCIQCGCIVGPRMRVRRLAPILLRAPRERVCGVAPDDLVVLPGRPEHLSRGARGIHDRVRSEIADSLMNVDSAVRLDHEQSIEARGACHICADDC